MDSKELIELCKIAQKKIDSGFCHTVSESEWRTLAQAYLATVRDDDGELITAEWLESIGFVDHKDADDCQNCFIACEDGFAIQAFRGENCQVTFCDQPPTRGQLRKLLEVLGGGA